MPPTAAVLSPVASKRSQHGRFAVRSGPHDPFAMHDMDRAVGVIRGAIERGERIVVYGDYDVDGITATCTLVDYLRTAGAACEYYIPNRLSEGYGLTRQAMEELYRRGTRLMINRGLGHHRKRGDRARARARHGGRHHRPSRVPRRAARGRSGHRLQAGRGHLPFDSPRAWVWHSS